MHQPHLQSHTRVDRSGSIGEVWIVGLIVMLSAGLGVWLSRQLIPISDELYSLKAIGNIGRYAQAPLYYIYLNAAAWVTDDFLSLRLWSLLPWVGGLLISRLALKAMGLSLSERLLALALLAFNPLLLDHACRVRYYSLFFMTGVLACWAVSRLAERSSPPMSALLWIAVMIPALVCPVGILLSVVLVVSWRWPRRSRVGNSGRRGPIIALVCTAATAGWAFTNWLAQSAQFSGWRATLSLPMSPGYDRPPVAPESLPHQFLSLLGWGEWVTVAHPGVVAGFGLAGFLLAWWMRLRRTPHAALTPWQWVALIPMAVCAGALIINVIHPRYYLYAAMPIAGVVANSLSSIPRVRLRAIVAALLLLLSSGSMFLKVTRGVGAWDGLCHQVKTHRIETLTVFPGRHAELVGFCLQYRGHAVSVSPAPWSKPPGVVSPRWLLNTVHRNSIYEDVGPPYPAGQYTQCALIPLRGRAYYEAPIRFISLMQRH